MWRVLKWLFWAFVISQVVFTLLWVATLPPA